MRSRSSLACAVAATVVAVLLGACTSSGIGTPVGGGGNNNAAVKVGITEWPAGDRGKPISLSGQLLQGGRLDIASLRGKVVVVNVWGSWCGPCVAEAPALASAHDELTPQGVRFVGLDTRDPSTSAATQFVTNHHQTWPSLTDADGTLLLAFRGKVNPSAIPATLVLDRSGRVAARVLGAVRTDTLTALVTTVLTEPSA
jgi:thiol-disulfide isomerase/thioredoxin